MSEEDSVTFVTVKVQGAQYRQAKRCRIGDTILECKSDLNLNNNSFGNNYSRNRHQESLPRNWLRLIETHIKLKSYNATIYQLSHHLFVAARNLAKNELQYFLTLLDNSQFGMNSQTRKPNKFQLKVPDIKQIKTFLTEGFFYFFINFPSLFFYPSKTLNYFRTQCS